MFVFLGFFCFLNDTKRLFTQGDEIWEHFLGIPLYDFWAVTCTKCPWCVVNGFMCTWLWVVSYVLSVLLSTLRMLTMLVGGWCAYSWCLVCIGPADRVHVFFFECSRIVTLDKTVLWFNTRLYYVSTPRVNWILTSVALPIELCYRLMSVELITWRSTVIIREPEWTEFFSLLGQKICGSSTLIISFRVTVSSELDFGKRSRTRVALVLVWCKTEWPMAIYCVVQDSISQLDNCLRWSKVIVIWL